MPLVFGGLLDQITYENVWVDIYPDTNLSDFEKEKTDLFASLSGHPLLLIYGNPGPDAILHFMCHIDYVHKTQVRWYDKGNNKLSLVSQRYLDQQAIIKRDSELLKRTSTDFILSAFLEAMRL